MARLYASNDIAERSLRMIGEFPITDEAVDSAKLTEALHWLDMLLAEKAGTAGDVVWLIPASFTLDLVGGTQAYDIMNDATDPPETGIVYVIDAQYVDENGNSKPLKLLNRRDFDAITDSDQSGDPEAIHVDRRNEPTLKTWPTPAAGVTGKSIRLTVQTYAPSLTGAGSDDNGNAETAIDMPAAWNLWAVTALAAEIGDGPVRKLPEGTVTRRRKRAEELWDNLEAHANRETESRSQIEPMDCL